MKLKKIIALALTSLICIMALPVTGSAADTAKYSTGSELVADITAGWNLGNTFDCYGNLGWLKDPLDDETAWSNPKTTKSMIDTVRKAGFNLIRIPVSWNDHIDEKGNIDKAWMDRLQEVVNYAYDSGMFVIVNTHHDESWLKFDKANYSDSLKIFTNVWKQISARFKNYGQRLIFEGMNEPRTVGSAKEWDGGTAEERSIINEFHKSFIKTVRNSGGNNKTRLLLLTPHAAKQHEVSMSDLYIPEDDKMIAVSIHAYVPDAAAFYNGTSYKYSENSEDEIDRAFENINKVFISKGIPVIMGEFGTTNQNNDAERAKVMKYYVSRAKEYGIPCCVWDNGNNSSTGDGFQLLDRKNNKMIHTDVVKAIISSAPTKAFTSSGKLAAPTGMRSSKNKTGIVLKWNAVKGADGYRVYMYNAKTGKYEKYKTVVNEQCTITDIQRGTEYKFVIAAVVKNSKGKYAPQTNSKVVKVTAKE